MSILFPDKKGSTHSSVVFFIPEKKMLMYLRMLSDDHSFDATNIIKTFKKMVNFTLWEKDSQTFIREEIFAGKKKLRNCWASFLNLVLHQQNYDTFTQRHMDTILVLLGHIAQSLCFWAVESSTKRITDCE